MVHGNCYTRMAMVESRDDPVKIEKGINLLFYYNNYVHYKLVMMRKTRNSVKHLLSYRENRLSEFRLRRKPSSPQFNSH